MSRIRCKDTKPELTVRSMLHRMGYRFRLHIKSLPGCPDIILPKHRVVIFVHGCFWHRHPGCKYAYTPKSRQAFWNEKFEINQKRHKKVTEELEKLGWKTFVIWECEAAKPYQLHDRIVDYLGNFVQTQPIIPNERFS